MKMEAGMFQRDCNPNAASQAASHPGRRSLHRFGLMLVLGMAMLVLAACPGKQLGFQGVLTDSNGAPLNGQYNFVFKLWSCGNCTTPASLRHTHTVNNLQVTNGRFDVPIGTGGITVDSGIDPALFAQELWLEIEIEGETLSPRQKLYGAPYAMTLAGGAVIVGMQEGNGPGDSDNTDANYGTLSVVAGGVKGTALIVNAHAPNGGDLIRGCTGALGGLSNRECGTLRFRVDNNGDVTAAGAFAAGGADFAEYITAADDYAYEPGDVMVISRSQDRAVELATTPYDPTLIGVYSTDPALVGGGRYLDDDGNAPGMLPVGIVGIVPVKVSAENGAIRRGDLLTTSSTPGHAMLATDYVPGAILGKAMGELDSGTGVIEVVLLLR